MEVLERENQVGKGEERGVRGGNTERQLKIKNHLRGSKET